MTATYVSTTREFQPPFGIAVSSIAGWMKQTLAARRARMANLRTLRSLDRETLDDIGVDDNVLNDPIANFVRANPYVIALSVMSGNRYFEI